MKIPGQLSAEINILAMNGMMCCAEVMVMIVSQAGGGVIPSMAMAVSIR